jgi:hypothetical protein
MKKKEMTLKIAVEKCRFVAIALVIIIFYLTIIEFYVLYSRAVATKKLFTTLHNKYSTSHKTICNTIVC